MLPDSQSICLEGAASTLAGELGTFQHCIDYPGFAHVSLSGGIPALWTDAVTFKPRFNACPTERVLASKLSGFIQKI